MIDGIRAKIEQSLAQFMERVKQDYKLHLVSPSLFESIKEFSLRQGKRIRPLLFVLSYKAYSLPRKRIDPSLYNACICVELLHNFMLIHDDIIDRSDLRRGKPTLHKMLGKIVRTNNRHKLGYDLGIIAGDIVYALAIDAFLSMKEASDRKEKALKFFVQTAAFTAMGEFIDTIYGVEGLDKMTEENVFLNYTLKTARYTFECPLVVGAILAGAPQEDIKKLSRLGILIGQAFQIQDDIIGVFDSQKNIGKSILSDIAESKKTLLVCHAYHHLSPKKRREFTLCFNKTKKTYQDLLTIRKIFTNAGSLKYCLRETENRIQQALKILDTVSMNKKYRKVIEGALLNLFKHSGQIASQYGEEDQAKILSPKT